MPRLGVCDRHSSFEIAAPAKQGSPHHWQLSKAHTGPRFACGFQNSIRDFATKLCRQQVEVIQNHHNPNVRDIGQGDAQHRK
jgi:hypothetical protein